ncbi:MAG: C4-dicarboxylate ABC transporter, partial [Treponema sp.]|nr:C4-dicarboxylate ABC transporter [Treponema sp.]
EQYRPALLDICAQLEKEINDSIASLEAQAIDTMVKYGLTVTTLNAAQQKEWYDDMAKQESKLVGPIFNADIYNKITAILDDYRKGRQE